jgi:hypothetical protein
MQPSVISANAKFGVENHGTGTTIAYCFIGYEIDGVTLLKNVMGGVSGPWLDGGHNKIQP